jgi:V-type H+-transporting ATPase subunit F
MCSLTQDTITGMLLAGVGHINEKQKKNFLIVDSSTLRVNVWRDRWTDFISRDPSAYD